MGGVQNVHTVTTVVPLVIVFSSWLFPWVVSMVIVLFSGAERHLRDLVQEEVLGNRALERNQ